MSSTFSQLFATIEERKRTMPAGSYTAKLFEDGENGELTAYRLVRPFLQGVRTHDMTGARLRALGQLD